MGHSRRGGFCSSMKEGSSSSAKRKKKKQADRMSPRLAAVFPEPEVIEDDCDLGKRLDAESFHGENESLWLSSDCNSPSSFFSEYRLYDFPQLTLDEWVILWPQVSRQLWFSLGKSIGFFDGSRINPIQEACLVLERNSLDTERFLQEDLREEEVVTWLLSSTENDAADSSSVIFSESTVSSFEESTGSESPSTPLSIHLKPSSSDSDLELDRAGFWVSLVDLDGEDFKWISDSESALDSLQSSDFPSPSYKTSSSSGVSVADDLEDFNTDELLFWPFKQKPDWNSKNRDCFSMSPRKNSNQRNAALLVPHTRKTDTDKVSRRLVFTSGSTASKILAWKRRSNNKGVRPTSTTPSRLSKPVKTVALESDNNIEEPTGGKVLSQIFLEEEFAANEELSIETLLGLDEFDGHEGVDSEFNKDDFSLDQSL